MMIMIVIICQSKSYTIFLGGAPRFALTGFSSFTLTNVLFLGGLESIDVFDVFWEASEFFAPCSKS